MDRRRAILGVVLAGAALTLVGTTVAVVANGTLTPTEQLGKAIFFDENLSANGNQSCATCHGPEAGWTGPDSAINAAGAVYEGSIPGAFGDRKPPSSAYATQSPVLSVDRKGLFVGGNFWDGRAGILFRVGHSKGVIAGANGAPNRRPAPAPPGGPMNRFFTVNEHPVERVLRVSAGLALVGFAMAGSIGPWGYLGLVPVLTGFAGVCPLYSVFGISTCPVKGRTSAN